LWGVHTDIMLNFRVDHFWPVALIGAYNSELSRLRL
jgi:hypothetical protein